MTREEFRNPYNQIPFCKCTDTSSMQNAYEQFYRELEDIGHIECEDCELYQGSICPYSDMECTVKLIKHRLSEYDKSRADTIKDEQTKAAKEILEIVREELAIARESETITPRVKYYLGNVIEKICKRFDINLEEE